MNREDEIFGEALELGGAERTAFLDRVCGTGTPLRARIEELLAAHAASERFMADSGAARLDPLPDEKPGDKIGRYTVLKKIGEGGCGVVYLAEQTEPVRRRVAVKVIKLGMDTREVIARFEAERQALAMMDHPDIARVFDAGSTAAGRPFFAMEFVDGVPITKFCDSHSLPMAGRLELFARVCLALQHAHQKGVIHRDIKPSNILVTLQDGVPTPKVIDFGIAKATQGRLTDATLYTGIDQLIGTPAYMSPEQADIRETDIDTRSDVYSLGVLLYELLTGRPPFDPKSLVRAGVEEIRRIIREVEPQRPSTVVQTLAAVDRATIAQQRHAGPARLTSVLRGDLDWIVMRCLEKDRSRRYDTAHELADDIRRHLRSDPINARPPSALYRAQKFLARHRLACTAGLLIFLSLLGGLGFSTWSYVKEKEARADALRRQEQAEDLLTFMLGDFRAELKKLGRLSLLDSVGEKSLAYFAALSPRDLTDTALTRQAKALTQIGETRIEQARYPEAERAFVAAYDRAAALAARHPENADMLFERAQAEYWRGLVADKRGQFTPAREWLTRYRDSALALARLESQSLRAQREITSGHHNLAVHDLDRGDLAAALTGFLAERTSVEAMLTTNPGDLSLRFRMADIDSWLGLVAERDGKYPAAIEHFTSMISRVDQLVALEPTVARWRHKLAVGTTLKANNLALAGRFADAATAYAAAQELLTPLVAQDPKNQSWQTLALSTRLSQASLLIAGKDPLPAGRIIADTRGNLEALVKAEPTSRVFTRILMTALRLETILGATAPNPAPANSLAQAIALGEDVIKEGRADNWVLEEYALSNILAGRIALTNGASDTATRHWRRAVEVLAPYLASSNDWHFLDPAAQALLLLGRPEEARPLLERLRRFGYHSTDPLAESTLGLAAPRP